MSDSSRPFGIASTRNVRTVVTIVAIRFPIRRVMTPNIRQVITVLMMMATMARVSRGRPLHYRMNRLNLDCMARDARETREPRVTRKDNMVRMNRTREASSSRWRARRPPDDTSSTRFFATRWLLTGLGRGRLFTLLRC